MNNSSQISELYYQVFYFFVFLQTSFKVGEFPLRCLICSLRKQKYWIVVSDLLGVIVICLLGVFHIKFQKGYVLMFGLFLFLGFVLFFFFFVAQSLYLLHIHPAPLSGFNQVMTHTFFFLVPTMFLLVCDSFLLFISCTEKSNHYCN